MIFKFIECNSKGIYIFVDFEAIAAMRLESRPPLNMNPIGTSATILFSTDSNKSDSSFCS